MDANICINPIVPAEAGPRPTIEQAGLNYDSP